MNKPIHLNTRVEGVTACGIEAESVGPTLWFATPTPERCPDCAAADVGDQCLILATLDVRIVADTRKQLADEICRLADNPRVYVAGWVESYYHPSRAAPRGTKQLEAIQAVAENLLARDNVGITEDNNRPDPYQG